MPRIMLALAVIFTATAVPNTAKANETVDLDKACDRLKVCASQELDALQVNDLMRQLGLQLVEQQCHTMLQPEVSKVEKAGLTNEANACLSSLDSFTCDDLKRAKELEPTSECDNFKTLADAAGIDTSGSQLETLKDLVQ